MIIDLKDNLNVTFLTEGSQSMGFGHLTRCLSISQALEEKGAKAHFIVNGDRKALTVISQVTTEVFDWINNAKRLFESLRNTNILFVDSLLISHSFYKQLVNSVPHIIFLDDFYRWSHDKGVIVDWTILADKLQFHSQNTSITYLLGTTYTSLRKDFWDVPKRRVKSSVSNILITFGGVDQRNLSTYVLRLLKKYFPNIKKTVVIAKCYTNISEIEAESDDNTQMIFFPNSSQMKENMLMADLAIASGGQTLYELARVGLPTISVISIDNQIDDTNGWAKAGFVKNAGWWNEPNLDKKIVQFINKLLDANVRQTMANLGQSYIDGQGARRIVNVILKLANEISV